MDRTIKIILFLICCISATNIHAQKKTNGIKGFPIYHVQDLEFEQDSIVLNLYYGKKKLDKNLALVDSTSSSIANDNLVQGNLNDSLNTQNSIAAPDYSSTEIDDNDLEPSFEISETGIDSTENAQKLVTLEDIDIFENDSLVYFDGNGNALVDSMNTRNGIGISGLSLPNDSLQFTEDWDLEQELNEGYSISDSLAYELSGELEQESSDRISNINIVEDEDLASDSLLSNQSNEVITVGQSEILIKSTDSFGKLERLKTPVFDPSVRTTSVILEPEKSIIKEQVEVPVPVAKEVQSTPVVINNSDGKYDALSTEEKNRQIVLDAESDRDLKQREMTLREKQLELELARRGISNNSSVQNEAKANDQQSSLSSYERDKQIRMDAENQRELARRDMALREKELQLSLNNKQNVSEPKTEFPKATPEQPAKNPIPIVVRPNVNPDNPTSRIVTDTIIVEKNVSIPENEIKDLLGQIDSKINRVMKADSVERKLENKKTNERISIVENKLDTLINALGEQAILNKKMYSNVNDEINVYFGVNSHLVTFNQKEQLKIFIDKIAPAQDFKIVLSGFADRSGDASYNKMLVDKRINAVKKTILGMGVAPKEVLINNYGDEKASTSSLYSKQDRKVTIQLLTN